MDLSKKSEDFFNLKVMTAQLLHTFVEKLLAACPHIRIQYTSINPIRKHKKAAAPGGLTALFQYKLCDTFYVCGVYVAKQAMLVC